MTDAENCMGLCGDVVDAYCEDGLRLERALAMLHKLSAPGTVEPYLGGQFYRGVEERLDVAEDMATHQWSTDLDDLEDDERPEARGSGFITEPPDRRCPICNEVLLRRPRESFAEFDRRETDSKSCAGQLRSRKNRAAKEAVAG